MGNFANGQVLADVQVLANDQCYLGISTCAISQRPLGDDVCCGTPVVETCGGTPVMGPTPPHHSRFGSRLNLNLNQTQGSLGPFFGAHRLIKLRAGCEN